MANYFIKQNDGSVVFLERPQEGRLEAQYPGADIIPTNIPASRARFYTVTNGRVVADLEEHRKVVSTRIKEGVAARLEGLVWRLERAQERDRIGAEGETVADVMREREAIRRAGNRAEKELEALADVEAIQSFTWEVLPEDYPPNPVMTRLQFMRRFTDEERKTMRAARDSGQSQDLLDFWELMQIATDVRLVDPDIQLGVRLLEQSGLIGEGRADEILGLES